MRGCVLLIAVVLVCPPQAWATCDGGPWGVGAHTLKQNNVAVGWGWVECSGNDTWEWWAFKRDFQLAPHLKIVVEGLTGVTSRATWKTKVEASPQSFREHEDTYAECICKPKGNPGVNNKPKSFFGATGELCRVAGDLRICGQQSDGGFLVADRELDDGDHRFHVAYTVPEKRRGSPDSQYAVDMCEAEELWILDESGTGQERGLEVKLYVPLEPLDDLFVNMPEDRTKQQMSFCMCQYYDEIHSQGTYKPQGQSCP